MALNPYIFSSFNYLDRTLKEEIIKTLNKDET